MSTDKQIRFIAVTLGIISLLYLINQFEMIWFMFTSPLAKWGLDMVMYFSPLFILAPASILIWKKKRLGWVLGAFYFAYSTENIILSLLSNLGRTPSGNATLDSLFPVVPTFNYFLMLLFYAGALWAMFKRNILESFRISTQSIVITILSSLIIVYIIVKYY
ncbi:MAG TPA: hypothetical protein VL651_05215 [Bacteroidia bacterium]|jgi:hypothetical protein|nr:hypothetical protein [Bacteroidia bacterium]